MLRWVLPLAVVVPLSVSAGVAVAVDGKQRCNSHFAVMCWRTLPPVLGQAVGIDSSTGESIALDSATMITLVDLPTGIIISAPTT